MSTYYLLSSLQVRCFGAAVIAADSLMLSEIPKSLRKQVNPHLEVIQMKQKQFKNLFLLLPCWDSGLVTVV